MKPGRYAAADGSFGRSAGAAMGRGVALLAVALLIGVVLLNKTDDRPPGSNVAAGPGASSGAGGGGGGGGGKGSTTTTSSSTTVPARQPKDVKVIVANASDVKGAAGRASEALKPSGYNVLAPTNTTAVKDSAVYFTTGYEREALALAAALGLPATTVKPLPTPAPFDGKTANVLIVLGGDQASRWVAAGSSGTTTTTASSAATTTTVRHAATTTTTTKR